MKISNGMTEIPGHSCRFICLSFSSSCQQSSERELTCPILGHLCCSSLRRLTGLWVGLRDGVGMNGLVQVVESFSQAAGHPVGFGLQRPNVKPRWYVTGRPTTGRPLRHLTPCLLLVFKFSCFQSVVERSPRTKVAPGQHWLRAPVATPMHGLHVQDMELAFCQSRAGQLRVQHLRGQVDRLPDQWQGCCSRRRPAAQNSSKRAPRPRGKKRGAGGGGA